MKYSINILISPNHTVSPIFFLTFYLGLCQNKINNKVQQSHIFYACCYSAMRSLFCCSQITVTSLSNTEGSASLQPHNCFTSETADSMLTPGWTFLTIHQAKQHEQQQRNMLCRININGERSIF